MSIPALGPKKVRKLAAFAGLDLDAAWSGNGREAFGRTVDHRHFVIDRHTGASREYVETIHWTSCPDDYNPSPEAGPLHAPPPPINQNLLDAIAEINARNGVMT